MKLNQFIGGCFGIVGFVVSILAGLYADNGFDAILLRAMLAAVACYVTGYIVGTMAQYAAKEHAEQIADKVAAADAEEVRKREEQQRLEAEELAAAGVVMENR